MGNEKFKNIADFILHAEEGDVWETETSYMDHLGNKVYKEGYEWLAADLYDEEDDDDFELTDELLEAGAKLYVERDMKRQGITSKDEYLEHLFSSLTLSDEEDDEL